MGRDGARIAAWDRPGEDFLRPVPLQGRERTGREREERVARNLLGDAGGLLEHLHGPGEESYRRSRGEHGCRVVERPRTPHFDGSHPERASDGGQTFVCFRPVPRDSRGCAAQDAGTASLRNGPEGMERSDLRATAPCTRERLEIERPGAMGDELSRTD
jgi:hypothetical protein